MTQPFLDEVKKKTKTRNIASSKQIKESTRIFVAEVNEV